MEDNNIQEELHEEVQEPQIDDARVELESRARAEGWVPKDEWTGEGKWRDAEEFLDRGELFKKIDAQRKEMNELRKNQAAFNTHLKKVRKIEFKRALEQLRKEKREALVEGDPDAVISADEKIAALRAEAERLEAEPVTQQTGEIHPEFQEWVSKNQWYASHEGMRAFADVEGTKLAQQGFSPREVLKKVEALVRKEFPHRFTNPNREKPSAVEGTTNKGTSAKAPSVQLTKLEKEVMDRLVRSGVMTAEEYMKDIKAQRERE